MKIRGITIQIRGAEGLQEMTRKEFIEYIDNFVTEGTTIEIVKLDY